MVDNLPGQAYKVSIGGSHVGQFASDDLRVDVDLSPKFPSFRADTRTEVYVVGAGIAGLTTAHVLTGDYWR